MLRDVNTDRQNNISTWDEQLRGTSEALHQTENTKYQKGRGVYELLKYNHKITLR